LSHKPTILVIGAGYLGKVVCRIASDAGHQVFAARRSQPSREESSAMPLVHWHVMDVLDPVQVREVIGVLAGVARIDAVIYCVSAGAGSVEAYHDAYRHGVTNVLAALDSVFGSPVQKSDVALPRFIFVSSTGVYPEDEGQWLDEFHQIDPDLLPAAQRAILEGEALVTARDGAVVARLSGIYGPGRTRLLTMARALPDPLIVEEIAWTNRIHVVDGARALIHLASIECPGHLYCVTDHDPAAQIEVLFWLRHQLGLPNPSIHFHRDGVPVASANGLPESNKRIANNFLVSTGFEFNYPTYREGYAPLCQNQ